MDHYAKNVDKNAVTVLRSRIAAFPQLDFYQPVPTPIQRLPRLSKALSINLWVKRDDLAGPLQGGNKGRKLAFLMADAQTKGAHKVVTFGGLQSNHARMTAAACAVLDIQAHLFFFEPKPATLRGNLLLNQLAGAQLHFIPYGGNATGSLTLEMTNRLVRLLSGIYVGPRAYFIPNGGHSARGCLGYVAALLELKEQMEYLGLPPQETTVVLAAGTGGTLAGLLAGTYLARFPLDLLAIDIGKLWKAFPGSIAKMTNQIYTLLDQTIKLTAANVPIIESTYVGPAYARNTPAAREAMQTAAQAEGLILDPVYTAKAFAGLLDLARNGRWSAGHHVIFLHTGGLPGLWAYEEDF